MEEIVNQLADLSGLRDRYALDDAVVRLVFLFGKSSVKATRLLRLVGEGEDLRCLTRAEFDSKKMAPARLAAWKDWRDLPALKDFPIRMQCRATGAPAWKNAAPWVTVLPIGEGLGVVGLLEIESSREIPADTLRVIEGILRLYANLENLLDYGEKDALTELLNRKTFDGAFFKAAVGDGDDADLAHADRRSAPARESYWLAIIDIDHFKSVNDTYGHLIGDEVLLLLARLMRSSFRLHDQLYRFGGEEFVILMRCANADDAARAVQRFCTQVAEHAFPQVGNITVSVGYTALREDDTPGGAFGRADKAVYYAKAHGRNQVVSYQWLLDNGHLTEEVVPPQAADFF
jgi:diguanylate cyclase (GGDEF)-like protein